MMTLHLPQHLPLLRVQTMLVPLLHHHNSRGVPGTAENSQTVGPVTSAAICTYQFLNRQVLRPGKLDFLLDLGSLGVG